MPVIYPINTCAKNKDETITGQWTFKDQVLISGQHFKLATNNNLLFGSGSESKMEYGTSQSNRATVFGLPVSSNSLIITEVADYRTDFGHSVESNPTVYIQNADATDTNKNLKLTTDADGGIIQTDKTRVRILEAVPELVVANQTGATVTLGSQHCVLVCDTTSNAITITLPAASAVGRIYIIWMRVDGGNNVTINCAGSDTFDGTNGTATLDTVEDFLQIVAIGNNRWIVLSDNGVVYS